MEMKEIRKHFEEIERKAFKAMALGNDFYPIICAKCNKKSFEKIYIYDTHHICKHCFKSMGDWI